MTHLQILARMLSENRAASIVREEFALEDGTNAVRLPFRGSPQPAWRAPARGMPPPIPAISLIEW